jgi:hypothetical protein
MQFNELSEHKKSAAIWYVDCSHNPNVEILSSG